MSFTNGQLFGAVVGIAAAVIFPGLGLTMLQGMSIGMTVGGIFDPPGLGTIEQEGPRLGDLSVQTAEWGTPIHRLFGTFKLAGNIIWALPIHETKHVEESGEGKGGGGTKTQRTWYSYAGSWAVAFCEGPISGFSKIWFDSVLVFDNENYTGGLTFENHQVYLGTTTQEVDWYIQSENADSPAYRNVSYIVFNTIELENYGNRIPVVTVEAVKNGDTTPKLVNTYTTPATGTGQTQTFTSKFDGLDPSEVVFVSNTGNSTIESYYNDMYSKVLIPIASKSVSHHIMGGIYSDVDCFLYSSIFDASRILLRILDKDLNQIDAYVSRTFTYNDIVYGSSNCVHDDYMVYIDGKATLFLGSETPSQRILVEWNGAYETLHSNDYKQLTAATSVPGAIYTSQDLTHIFYLNNSEYYVEVNNVQYPIYQKDGIPLPGVGSAEGNEKGLVFYDDTYIYLISPRYCYRVNKLTNIINAYNFGQVIASDTDYLRSITVKNGNIYTIHKSERYTYYFHTITTDQVTLSSICTELMLRAGLESDDIDTLAGTVGVIGYVVATPMATRAALDSITSAYKFDIIESDFKIQLKARNPTSLDTIEEDDIVDLLQIERLQTVDLSRGIDIAYVNKAKNYEAGIQSALRSDANVETIKRYQYAIVLTDTEAKQLAELYLYSLWNERTKYEVTLPIQYIYLEPADTITVNYENRSFTIRITEITYTNDYTVMCKAVNENSHVYESEAIGSDTANTYIEEQVSIYGPTRLELLDIPMLDNSLNSEGIYIAAGQYTTGWKGCAIDKSIDTGLTYNEIGQVVNSVNMGNAISVLASGPTTIYDLVNTVKIGYVGELYSSTWENLLNGQNYILIGDEILQYKDVTDNNNGTYTLSNLLRGRRGTEWAIGTHSVGDRVIFLSSNLFFDSTAALNVDSYYRATTFGTFVEDGTIKNITPDIICLKPFAPSIVHATRETNNDITITWMNRSRDVTGYFKTLALFEETESYEVEIELTGTNRVISVTSETATYTEADQTTDGTLGSSVTFTVYQLSGIVGRGYGTQRTI